MSSRPMRAMAALLLVVAMLAGLLASPAAAKGKKSRPSSDSQTTETVKADSTATTRKGKKKSRTADTTVAEPTSTPTPVDDTPPATADPATTDEVVVLDPVEAEPILAEAKLEAAPSLEAEALEADATTSAYDAVGMLGSMYNVVDQIGARTLWQKGITGEGIHVAVIDTGIAPVPAMTGADKVVAMVDLSFEATVPEAVYLDTNGHGTHMAGIIAGRTPGADPATSADNPDQFFGVAPGAGIVSVKVGDNTGAVDVSQVIAGIDWVIQHKNEGDLNIRVLNLSYGTDSTQPYEIDPLSHAVERAWDAGIVVVAAAGNEGWMAKDGLANPAHDPYVIAVGAAEATDRGMVIPDWTSAAPIATTSTKGALTPTAWDDYDLWFSEDYHERTPDLVAPGAHIDSLRVPGSRVAFEHPEGYVTDDLFRGSGSSQATAVVSGAAALLLDARPDLTPDQVKAMLMTSAEPIPWAIETMAGRGMINVYAAVQLPAPDVTQDWPTSDGSGSIDAARGTQRVIVDGEPIEGEVIWTGEPWTGASWSGVSWSGASWTGASWTGASWSGSSWTGASWTGASWSGASWTGVSWSGASWSGASWTGASWSGASWTGASWSGASWTGVSWSGCSWSDSSWS